MTKLFLKILTLLVCTSPLLAQSNKPSTDKNASKKKLERLQKLDGVAGVVGSFVILDSDIKRAYLELESQNISTKDMTDCKILENLMEDKLYAHQAIQDSIVVTESEVREYVNRQIEYSLQQFDNDMTKLLAFYKKTDQNQLRSELMEYHKTIQLSQREQSKITEEIKVTPDEVRQFFKKIPKSDLPYFGTELEISQIIIKPKVSQEEINKVIAELRKIKEDVEDNGSSFASKALLYSEDPGSRPKGGFYTITKKSPMVQEFKDTAFSLKEGETSEPFQTEYGWHIMKLDRIRGNEYDVRHILLIPVPNLDALTEAYKRITTLRKRIIDGEISFENAALKFSDEKETKFNKGKLINPKSLTTKFELTKIDPVLYGQIQNLKDSEISAPLLEESKSREKSYKIIKISNRIDGHTADFSKDYDKIQNLALNEKKIKVIKEWIKDKINFTYLYINNKYKNCDFTYPWLKE